jgi:integrase
MEGRQERAEPLDRAHDLSSLSGEVEAVARGDRSMQQCHRGDGGKVAVRRLLDPLTRPPLHPDLAREAQRDGPRRRSVQFRVVCNLSLRLGCVTMGMKRDPAARLCGTCGHLKATDQFEPGRRKCVPCQKAQPSCADNPGTPHDPLAAVRARARGQALRRLGLENLNAYREFYRAERRAIAANVAADLARKRAVSRALRALEREHRQRYDELYQQQFKRARSQRHPRRPGRPAGSPDRLTIASETASAWRRAGAGRRQPQRQGEGARQQALLQEVRERAAELFAEGRSAATVADELNVARQTATEWRARWQSGGAAALRNRRLGRPPAVPDSQLPAIEQALLKGAEAHGFDSNVWTSTRVAVVIQQVTGVQLGSQGVQRLLRERLGWRFQPATSGVTVVTAAAQPLPTPASATDSLAAVAAAALANLEDLPAGMPGLARSSRPASPAERRDAIAQAWRDDPGISDPTLAERFGVSGRTIQRDTQALQERGIQRRAADRRRRSHRTRAHYAAIYRRFLAWLADELGRPPTRRDLSGDVLARWIAQRASVGGHGGGGLSPASLRLECSALRRLARHAGRPELAASLSTSRRHAPPPETISPAQYERLLGEPDLTTPVGVRDRAILRLLGDVGLRPSEVCALTVGDIVWSADGQAPVQLKVAWGKGRVVQLTPETTSALADWLASHPDWQSDGGRRLPAEAPLFVVLGPPKPTRQAIAETGLLRQVLRHAEQAGIPAHLRYPYVLRHYWATQEVSRGITVAQLQARGGWRDRRSAQAYFHRPPAALGLNHGTPPEP